MTPRTWRTRPPGCALLAAASLGVSAVIFVGEALLVRLAPYSLGRMGHQYCENARLYGWGLTPHERVVTGDPDVGSRFVSRTNSRGWRDRERRSENPSGAFRILVLGDSNSFGPLVPLDGLYTTILEDTLTGRGLNVEVINISYMGWGTDQHYEALVREGLRYNPRIVVVQFCLNDLTDNTFWTRAEYVHTKPFIYRLDDQGALLRVENTQWRMEQEGFSAILKRVVLRSEILKRVYGLVDARARPGDARGRERAGPEWTYQIEPSRLKTLDMVTGPWSRPLLPFLRENRGKAVTGDRLREAAAACGLEDSVAVFERVFDPRPLQSWTVNECTMQPPDKRSAEWLLFGALLEAMGDAAHSEGADLAIFCQDEGGYFEWLRSWYRISGDAAARQNYFAHIQAVRELTQRDDVGFIEMRRRIARSRLDSHPNAEGNRALAANIRDYLLARYGEELENHRRP